MDRRDALRLLATGAALQLAPRNLLVALREARAQLTTPVALRTLNPHQDATVKAMAELILPKTDTPGATDVGAGEFIDRTRFLNGLSEVDLHTRDLFGKNFVEASPDQQAEILAWLGEKMTAEADVMGTGRQRRGSSRGSSASFYPMLRRLTLTAYYTSEAGATEELHFQVIPDSHAGCAAIPPPKGGAEN
jgi:gluconate 2-dehydrogenase gamma chain